MAHGHNNIELLKPLLLTAGAFTLVDINQMLGFVSLVLSIAYTVYKFKKEKK